MAAGRHRGGHRDNRFRDREDDFEVSKKENGFANGVYEVTRNGVRENERGQGRVQGRLESGVRVRQNDIRDSEVVNGRHFSISTRSNSGSSGSGGPGRRGLVIPAVDREPGELSSDGSDDAIDSDFHADGIPRDKMIEDKNQLCPNQNKKRKFSPIVWDRDDGQVAKAIKSRLSAENSSLSAFPARANSRSQTPNPSPDGSLPAKSHSRTPNSNPSPDANLSAKSHSQTPNSNPSPDGNLSAKSRSQTPNSNLSPDENLSAKSLSQTPNSNPSPDGNLSAKSHSQTPNSNPSPDGNLQTLLAKTSPHGTDIRHDVSDFPAENSCVHLAESGVNMENGVVDVDDYVPMRTIISSRWANDADSPADEGESSKYEDTPRLKNKPGPDLAEIRLRSKSASPEDGELKRGDSEETRGRSSGSDQCVRSSYRESYHDDMETDDDQNYDGTNINHSESESENGHSSPELVFPQQRNFNMLHGCRSVDEFEKLNKINEGTYGVVYRARDKKTGEIVALKKVKMEKEREGFPLTSLREINILLSFDYPSIVNVKEVVMGNLDSIFMVMEYMEHDLKALMETIKQPFSQSEVKCLMLQLLGGVKYLHDNWVLHRDLKTSNLLLNNCGELKICDFGLARQYGSPLKPYTQLVVTLWYRAPELLLGAKQYSTAIDMWSVGCIMAELLSKEPLFNGKTEFDQLDKIFRILGTPNEKIWPGFSKLPGVKVNFVKHQYNLLRRKFKATSFTGSPVLSDAGFDLLSKLLTYDPEKRITAEAALNHEWFREVPLPKSKEFMPTFPAHHAQDRYMRRVIKSPDPLEEQRRKELQQEVLGTTGLFGQ